MSWLALDSKGDLARNYGAIAKNCYGYQNVAVIDLRNPTRSDGNNLLTLVNRYMDIARSDPNNLAARPRPRNTPKSCPRPSSIQTAMTATAARMRSSTMRRKGFSPRSS